MITRMVRAHAPYSLVGVAVIRERSPHRRVPAPEPAAATSHSIDPGTGVGEVAWTTWKIKLRLWRLAIIVDIEKEGIGGERGIER